MTARGESISRRLPLVTTALFIAAVGATAAIAYREMKASLLRTAADRVTTASRQVADVVGASYDALARAGSPLSRDSLLRAAVQTPPPVAGARARARLDSLSRADTTSIALVLLDRRLAAIASAGRTLDDSLNGHAYLGATPSMVGPMLAFHDTVAMDVRFPIMDGRDTVGFVRRLSRVSSRNQRQLLSGLIGDGGSLLIGNRGGAVWTDLNGRAATPTRDTVTGRAIEATDPTGMPTIGALAPIAHTSWVVWVGFSHGLVLAPARAFLWRILAIDLVIIAIATLAAWRISRRVAGPVIEITHAAEALAKGDFTARSAVVRRDEIGRLATAFNTMAAAIQISTVELEEQAVELELQSTELEETNEELRHNIEEVTRERLRAEQLQTQLAQARKMEAIGRLAGGVAHDFNNILTVVISYSDLVLGDRAISETTRADVSLIRQAADRAAALTRQLLAFSRKQVLRPEVLNPNDVIEDVFGMLKRVIPANITVAVHPSATLPRIFADRGQMEQVLMNLAVNARDAMPDGGNLVIETEEATLDEAYLALHPGGAAGRHVVISMRDTGCGMDAETKARIFEPFFTTKGPGQGTGLGLATVYGIVQQSGGSVYVYSEPGHGTTFKLYFPVHEGETPVAAPTLEQFTATDAPLHILLVEDDAAVRTAVLATIERLGHEVRSAANVDGALALIRADDGWTDVVLTDAVMPGQSGLDLADILSVERPELPVIVVSGYSEEAVTGGRVSSRAVFLEKPFTSIDLARALAKARADRRPRRAALLT